MRWLGRLVVSMLVRSLIVTAVGWGVAFYVTGDTHVWETQSRLRKQALSSFSIAADAMKR